MINGIQEILLKVNESHQSCESSITILNKYSEALRLALDETRDEESTSNKDKQWFEVTELFEQQSAHVKNTNEKINAAKYLKITI